MKKAVLYLGEEPGKCFIVLDSGIRNSLLKWGPSEADAEVSAVKWLHKTVAHVVVDGLPLWQRYQCTDVPVWWYLGPWIRQTQYAAGAGKIIQLIEAFENCIEQEKIGKVVVCGGASYMRSAVVSQALAMGVEIRQKRWQNKSTHYHFLLGRIKCNLAGYCKVLRFVVRRMLWGMAKLIYNRNNRKMGEKYHSRPRLMLVGGDWWQTYYNKFSEAEIRGDAFYGDLMSALAGKVKIHFVQYIKKTRLFITFFEEKRHDMDVVYSPFEGALKWRDFFSVYLSNRKVKNEWKHTRKLIKKVRYKNSNCTAWLIDLIDQYFIGHSLEHQLGLRSAERSLQAYVPHHVLIAGEMGPWGTSYLLACGKAGVSVNAVQHGVFLKNHFWIHFNKDDYGAINTLYPDAGKYYLFGDFYRELLRDNGSYLGPQWEVIGNLRSQQSHNINIRSGLVKEGELTVLYLTGYTGENGYKNFRDCMMALMEMNNFPIRINIKLHPGDSDGRKYKSMMNGSAAVVTFYEGRGGLEELLEQSDVAIAEFSTALFEAAASGAVPMIIDLYNAGYHGLFAPHGGVLNATSLDEIKRNIEDIYAGNINRSLVADFAYQHLGGGGHPYYKIYSDTIKILDLENVSHAHTQ